MRAIRVQRFGGPEHLSLDELPEPVPGPGEVAVRVRACSLNYRDLMVVKGLYNPKAPLPLVPLSDGAGEVAALGPGVTRVALGDRVASGFMPGWVSGPVTDEAARGALGAGGLGMLAETVVLPETGLVGVPDHLTLEEAATLPCAAVTAWNALVTEGQVKAGDTVLVQGTGGVSVFALQFALLHGARVIATSSSDDKLDRMRELGASDGINYRTNPDWEKRVRELTHGQGVDHVVEVGGSGTLGRSLKAVRTGGRIAMIGVLSGGSAEVTILPILMKHIRVQGIFVGSVSMFEAMNRAISLHNLHPIVDRLFPMTETAEALRHMERGAHFGKIVIRLG
ncbi:MAG: NAD(P)-dependent alcohol dehydrogenase [Isosphaeraceae bacterium]